MEKKAKIIIGLLAVSLAINVFFFGLYIGKHFGEKHPRYDKKQSVFFSMGRISKYLSKDEKARAKEILHKKKAEMWASFKDVRSIEDEIREILSAEVVDRNKLKIAIDARAEKIRNVADPMTHLILEFVPNLDVETRRKMAKGMFKKYTHHSCKAEKRLLKRKSEQRERD